MVNACGPQNNKEIYNSKGVLSILKDLLSCPSSVSIEIFLKFWPSVVKTKKQGWGEGQKACENLQESAPDNE